MRTEWVCPYCGHKNKQEIKEHELNTSKLTACWYEDGGCDRLLVIKAKATITTSTFKIEGEGEYDGHGNVLQYQEGITKRDYFAAKAMQGMLTNPDCDVSHKVLVDRAFEFADWMIERRSR